jgi:hypothetical protein
VAKILEKESSNKIRETREKTMFTPSNPIKATYKSYRYCLGIRMLPNCPHELSDIRSLDCQRVFSNICLPDYKQRFSNKRTKLLAIKTMLSDAGDIMLMSSS